MSVHRPVFEKYMKHCIENKIGFGFECNPNDIDGNIFSLYEVNGRRIDGCGKDLEECVISFLNESLNSLSRLKEERENIISEIDARTSEINQLLLVDPSFEEDENDI